MDDDFSGASSDSAPEPAAPAAAPPAPAEPEPAPADASEEPPAPPQPPPPPAPLSVRALAGLEAGVLGGLVMLLWFGLDSWLHREFVWKVPHLLASLFYGQRVFRPVFGVVTLAGIALVLFQAGSVGALFACLLPRPPHPVRLVVAALTASMSWYWLSQTIFWRHWIPELPVYTSPATMVVAHILFGVSLARYGSTVETLRRAFPPPPAGD